jgi:ADP-heptose:LPS heptosyltransferase
MKKILIFKTDRLGDLLNISPIINNLKLNYPNSSITLICSEYNKSIAKYYHNDFEHIVFEKPLILFLLKNIKFLFFNNYDFIFQLDGKNHSYLTSILIKAKKKVCIRFLKSKKILGLSTYINRPNFLINYFFDEQEISNENYNIDNNINYHYLSLYLNLLKKLNIKILSKNHYLPFNKPKKISNFNDGYCLIHIDQRWEQSPLDVSINLKKKILILSKSTNIVISSNVGGNKVFEYLNNELLNKPNIEFINDPNLHDTISLVYNSKSCISGHSGLIVHTAAAFNKKIIDIVSKDIFNELDRWIPYNVIYKRIDINNFIEVNFEI